MDIYIDIPLPSPSKTFLKEISTSRHYCNHVIIGKRDVSSEFSG